MFIGATSEGPVAPDTRILSDILGETAPNDLARELLPLSDATRHLLPSGGLRPGNLVQVRGGPGATTLALALLVGPCRSGASVGCVGFPELGWEAVGELGLPLGRVVVAEVPDGVRGDFREKVLAAMVDAFEIVLCGPEVVAAASTVRKLRARTRERGTVLVQVPGLQQGSALVGGSELGRESVLARGPAPSSLHTVRSVGSRSQRSWSQGDVVLDVISGEWEGLGEGWGSLSRRTLSVEVSGRGKLSRPRHCEVIFDSRGHADGGRVVGGGVDDARGETSTVSPHERVLTRVG